MTTPSLYGSRQSRFAAWLERRERERPDPVAREHRRRLLAGLEGRVVEVGCGDGRAFALYPTTVEHVLAVEPDPVARELAEARALAAPVPIDVVEGDAEHLPADDGSIDAVVLVWVLCSVAEPAAALREVRRVLRDGGRLAFYEHVRATGAPMRALQRTVDAMYWTRALGGCRTSRDTERAIREAGYRIDELARGRHSSSLLTLPSAPFILGSARRSTRDEPAGPLDIRKGPAWWRGLRLRPTEERA